jgi:hypothetical protein
MNRPYGILIQIDEQRVNPLWGRSAEPGNDPAPGDRKNRLPSIPREDRRWHRRVSEARGVITSILDQKWTGQTARPIQNPASSPIGRYRKLDSFYTLFNVFNLFIAIKAGAGHEVATLPKSACRDSSAPLVASSTSGKPHGVAVSRERRPVAPLPPLR